MQQSTACLHVRGVQRRCVWAVGRLGVAACLACVAAAAVDRQARRCELASTRRSVGLCDLESVAALTDQPGMQKRSDSGDDRETARLPSGRNFCPHSHPTPMAIPVPTADMGNSGRIGGRGGESSQICSTNGDRSALSREQCIGAMHRACRRQVFVSLMLGSSDFFK